MQRDTGNTEAITVEYGFLDSPNDDVQQLKNNWENYAEAVVRAIIEYLNLNYIPKEGENYYKVVSGDSLWSIAKKNNVTVSELKNANGLSNSSLKIGQILKIPQKEIKKDTSNTYVVKSGDSLYKIAKNYDTDVDSIISLNNLTNTNLSIGQILNIPSKSTIDVYTVVSGDSLYKIANKYNTTVNELKNLNNLTNNNLSIGQQLKVPTIINTDNIYTVVSGDSLYKIANKYNTTVNELKNLNNLTNNNLSIGQQLKIK